MKFTEKIVSFDELYEQYTIALDDADNEIKNNSIAILYNKPSPPSAVFNGAQLNSLQMMVVTEITSLSQDQITDLVGYYTGWMIFFEQQFIEARLRKGAAVHAKKNLEWALKCYFHDQKGVKTTQVDAHVKSRDEWKAADREEFHRTAIALKTEASMKAAKQMVFHLSRGQSGKADALRTQGIDEGMQKASRNPQPRPRRGRRSSHDDFGL